MTILVTGGSGFIGVNLVRHLARQGHDVVLFSRSAARQDPDRDAFLAPFMDRIRLFAGDVQNREDLRRACEQHAVRRIAHVATISPSPEMEEHLASVVLGINILGTLNVLDVAREMGVERVVYTSSAAVYKANSELEPVDEYDALDLKGLYPISKHASEQLCRVYSRNYGLECVIARLGWIYGPMERPTGGRTRMSEIYNIVRLALAGEVIRINDLDRYRDWTHVDDVSRGLQLLLEAQTLGEMVYNLSCGRAYTARQIIDLVRVELGELQVEGVATRDEANVPVNVHNRRGPLSIRRLQRDFGFEPQVPIKEGLVSYIRWVRQHPL